MYESQLSVLIKSALDAGLLARGLTAQVKKAYQSRQQGVPSGPIVTYHHIITIDVGYPERLDTNGLHTETQNRESRYQIGALAPANLADATQPLAADYANAAKLIMQSDATRALLLAAGVGIQKPGNTNVVYFVDDKDQHESNPSFDVILSHQDIFTTTGTTITAINPAEFSNI